MKDYTTATLGELLTSKDEVITRNSMSILKRLMQAVQKRKEQETSVVYVCDECKEVEHWTAELFADKGEPVCWRCDTDMTRQI